MDTALRQVHHSPVQLPVKRSKARPWSTLAGSHRSQLWGDAKLESETGFQYCSSAGLKNINFKEFGWMMMDENELTRHLDQSKSRPSRRCLRVWGARYKACRAGRLILEQVCTGICWSQPSNSPPDLLKSRCRLGMFHCPRLHTVTEIHGTGTQEPVCCQWDKPQ